MKKLIPFIVFLLLCLPGSAMMAGSSDGGVEYAHFRLHNTNLTDTPYIQLAAGQPVASPYRVSIHKQDALHADLSITTDTGKPGFSVSFLPVANADLFFAVTREAGRTDLIYFGTAGSGSFLNALMIIGQTGDTFQRLFSLQDIPEAARQRLGSGCRLQLIPDKGERMGILLSSGSTSYLIHWDGKQYTGHFLQ